MYVDGSIEDGKPYRQFLAERPEANLVKYANKTHRKIGKLKKERREIVKEGGSKDRVKNIEN